MSCSKERRKSRRRSSLAPIRIAPSHGVSTVGELHKSVRSNLPRDERLAALTKVCFQYAMDKIEKEMTDIENLLPLHCSARDRITKVVSNLKNDGVFHKACTKDACVPNSQNEENARTIRVLEAHEQRLTKESEEWLALKETMGAQALKASLVKIKDYIPEDDLSPSNQSNASNYLPYTMDYNSILKDLQKKADVATHLIHEHAQCSRLLTGVHDVIVNVLDKKRHAVDAASFESFARHDSPRRLITGLCTAEAPAATKTHN